MHEGGGRWVGSNKLVELKKKKKKKKSYAFYVFVFALVIQLLIYSKFHQFYKTQKVRLTNQEVLVCLYLFKK